jgi:sulfatase maturation enzyme AslB (radical SAM superfamily)
VFKNISVQCSIDGIENHYNYLRYGGNWEDVEQNMKKYYEFAVKNKKFKFGIHYTLSWMNSLHFKDFCAWLIKTFPHYDSIGLYLTKLVGPAEYSVDILSVESKEKILEINVDSIKKLTHPLKLTNTTARSKIINTKTNIDVILLNFIELYRSSLINYVTSEDDNRLPKTMLAQRALTQLDGIRNTDYKKTFNDVLPYLEKFQ